MISIESRQTEICFWWWYHCIASDGLLACSEDGLDFPLFQWTSAQLVSTHFISSHFETFHTVSLDVRCTYILIESVKQANIKTNVPSHLQLDQMKQWIKKSAYEQIVDAFCFIPPQPYMNWLFFIWYSNVCAQHQVVFQSSNRHLRQTDDLRSSDVRFGQRIIYTWKLVWCATMWINC